MSEEHTGALIVATPTADDPVNSMSQEDQAHVTLLWFGEASNLPEDLVDEIRVELDGVTAAMGPFTARIAGACVLGPDRAAALLVESEDLVILRNELGDTPAVRAAQMMAERQFPWWIPHLTLGYAADQQEMPVQWPDNIRFDAAGLWLGGQHTAYPLNEQAHLGGNEIMLQEDGFLSSGLIPPVYSVADVPMAVSFAATHPDSRWYVEKRCAALGVTDRLPSRWPG